MIDLPKLEKYLKKDPNFQVYQFNNKFVKINNHPLRVPSTHSNVLYQPV